MSVLVGVVATSVFKRGARLFRTHPTVGQRLVTSGDYLPVTRLALQTRGLWGAAGMGAFSIRHGRSVAAPSVFVINNEEAALL